MIVIISVFGPVLGSLIGVLKKPNDSFMYNMLSFAAGVMLAISFLELLPESIKISSEWTSIAGIISGALIMYAVDKLLPHIHPALGEQEQGKNLNKTAALLIAGIFLHNFPEGMAMAIGSVSDIKVSIAVAIAIAVHDIPEAICTSAPYYFSTGKRLKSFLVSSVTAVPTLLGFMIARYLYGIISLPVVGFIAAATAGLMIYICADELIPVSSGKGTSHSTIFSLIVGVVFVVLLGRL